MWAKIGAALVALFAYLTGRRAGEEAVQQADQTASLKQQVEIANAVAKADAAAPRSDADLDAGVRNGTDF
jgi:hypothetical protein